MRHFSAFFSVLVLLALGFFTACGGGNGTPVFGNPATITVTPATTSLTLGEVQNPNIIVADSKGTTLFASGGAVSSNVTFTSSNASVLSVSQNGLLCAGTWDNVAAPVVCNAGPAGQAVLTVNSGGIASTPITYFVHQAVARIDVTGVPTTLATCISQNATQQLTAKVYSSTTADPTHDITATVGPLSWLASNTDVVTVDPATLIATALNPGQTNLSADAGTFRSPALPFTVCPVTAINIHVKGATDTSVTLDAAGTSTLSADLVDKNNTVVTIAKSIAGTAAALTWTTGTASAAVSPVALVRADVTATSTNDATLVASRAGTSSIVASCTPPNCNTGLAPVYSNVFTEKTNGTTSTVVFVTGTDTTQLIPIATSTNAPGTAITLSNQPNSLLIGPDGVRALLGSAGGLMVVDATALTLTTTIAAVTGNVLAIAPDGKTAVVSDPTKGQVFIGDVTTGAFQVFPIGGVTAAAFSRDQLRVFLASPTAISVITNGATQTLPIGASSVAPYANGAFTYVASGSVPVVATCNVAKVDTIATSGATLVNSLQDGSQVLAAGPGTLDAISVTVGPNANNDPNGCPPAVTNTLNTPLAFTGTPSQLFSTSDSTRAFLTNDTANLITYDATAKTVSSIALAGSPTASFTGGVTLDGTQLYVGVAGAAGSTPVVHRIDLTTNTDAQQITASTTAFTPNLVAVRP